MAPPGRPASFLQPQPTYSVFFALKRSLEYALNSRRISLFAFRIAIRERGRDDGGEAILSADEHARARTPLCVGGAGQPASAERGETL